jgi:fructan beta-fructosidase
MDGGHTLSPTGGPAAMLPIMHSYPCDIDGCGRPARRPRIDRGAPVSHGAAAAAYRVRAAALLASILVLAACAEPSSQDASTSAVADAYAEAHRPQFHFTPPSMWMNDPNGMVYYDGEYHLFYQYYPDDIVWGPMHWGHAVSRDLVTWEHLPIALYPDSLGYIFSGSAVVDWNNTSGFGTADDPPMVAIFTYHDPVRGEAGTNDHETQGIAYSTDRGRTWTKYTGNPVLPNQDRHRDFRDPNVFWHEGTSRWIMVLSVFDRVELWASPDLKSWTFLSEFGEGVGGHGGTWECPDLFPLQIDGTNETKWVLILNLNPGGPQGGSGTQYFVGDFDGERFTLDPSFAATLREDTAVWLDYGRDNYAGVTWADVPPEDGRRIFIGWMSNWDYAQVVPTSTWRSAMTLPRTLHLERTDAGYRVFSEPVHELEALRAETASLPSTVIDGLTDLTDRIAFPMTTSEMLLEFRAGASAETDFGIELSNATGERYRIGIDRESNQFYSDRTRAGDHSFSDSFADRIHRAPRLATDDIIRMRLFFDVASVELFADGGATVLTDIFFPTEPFDRATLYSVGGPVDVTGEVHRLRGSW